MSFPDKPDYLMKSADLYENPGKGKTPFPGTSLMVKTCHISIRSFDKMISEPFFFWKQGQRLRLP